MFLSCFGCLAAPHGAISTRQGIAGHGPSAQLLGNFDSIENAKPISLAGGVAPSPDQAGANTATQRLWIDPSPGGAGRGPAKQQLKGGPTVLNVEHASALAAEPHTLPFPPNEHLVTQGELDGVPVDVVMLPVARVLQAAQHEAGIGPAVEAVVAAARVSASHPEALAQTLAFSIPLSLTRQWLKQRGAEGRSGLATALKATGSQGRRSMAMLLPLSSSSFKNHGPSSNNPTATTPLAVGPASGSETDRERAVPIASQGSQQLTATFQDWDEGEGQGPGQARTPSQGQGQRPGSGDTPASLFSEASAAGSMFAAVEEPLRDYILIAQPRNLGTLASALAGGNTPAACALGLGPSEGLPFPLLLQLAADVARGLQVLHKEGKAHGHMHASHVVLVEQQQGQDEGQGQCQGQPQPQQQRQRQGGVCARLLCLGLTAVPSVRDLAYRPGSGPLGCAAFAEHIAPELQGGGPPTAAGDIWALGMLMHGLYKRKPMMAGEPAAHLYRLTDAQLRPVFPSACPMTFARLVLLCLAQDPSQRPSIAAVAQELGALQRVCYSWPSPVLFSSTAGRRQVASGSLRPGHLQQQPQLHQHSQDSPDAHGDAALSQRGSVCEDGRVGSAGGVDSGDPGHTHNRRRRMNEEGSEGDQEEDDEDDEDDELLEGLLQFVDKRVGGANTGHQLPSSRLTGLLDSSNPSNPKSLELGQGLASQQGFSNVGPLLGHGSSNSQGLSQALHLASSSNPGRSGHLPNHYSSTSAPLLGLMGSGSGPLPCAATIAFASRAPAMQSLEPASSYEGVLLQQQASGGAGRGASGSGHSSSHAQPQSHGHRAPQAQHRDGPPTAFPRWGSDNTVGSSQGGLRSPLSPRRSGSIGSGARLGLNHLVLHHQQHTHLATRLPVRISRVDPKPVPAPTLEQVMNQVQGGHGDAHGHGHTHGHGHPAPHVASMLSEGRGSRAASGSSAASRDIMFDLTSIDPTDPDFKSRLGAHRHRKAARQRVNLLNKAGPVLLLRTMAAHTAGGTGAASSSGLGTSGSSVRLTPSASVQDGGMSSSGTGTGSDRHSGRQALRLQGHGDAGEGLGEPLPLLSRRAGRGVGIVGSGLNPHILSSLGSGRCSGPAALSQQEPSCQSLPSSTSASARGTPPGADQGGQQQPLLQHHSLASALRPVGSMPRPPPSPSSLLGRSLETPPALEVPPFRPSSDEALANLAMSPWRNSRRSSMESIQEERWELI